MWQLTRNVFDALGLEDAQRHLVWRAERSTKLRYCAVYVYKTEAMDGTHPRTRAWRGDGGARGGLLRAAPYR